MKAHRFLRTLLLLWLGATLCSWAQAPKAERDLFEQTRKQAGKGDPEAELRLGTLYAEGIGVKRDHRKGAKWHRKAAEAGLARAQYQLGLDYAQGEGLKPDDIQAAKWFQQAAGQGLAEAQLQLGLCYLGGHGVQVDAAEGVRLLREAAAQGLPSAEYDLGTCYLEGTGVSKDLLEGMKHVQRAAEAGDGPAENRLGLAYQKGEGFPKDLVQAYKWFALAAAHDNADADDIRLNLAKAETQMSPEQVAQAQRLASQFQPVRLQTPAPPATTNSPALGSAPATNSSLGEVNVQADSKGSEIYVDGSFVGNPPAQLKLSPGPHVVEVKQAGYQAYRRQINVGAGSDLTLRAVLTKQ